MPLDEEGLYLGLVRLRVSFAYQKDRWLVLMEKAFALLILTVSAAEWTHSLMGRFAIYLQVVITLVEVHRRKLVLQNLHNYLLWELEEAPIQTL